MDFFREVNKDAHVLKRMGSDGVHGCGGMIVSCLASCFRRIGLGNPGASVGQVSSNDCMLKDTTIRPHFYLAVKRHA